MRGYLVVLRDPEIRSGSNPKYRGVYRMPPYPTSIPEESVVIDDYVFGKYKDSDGLIPTLALANQLVDGFSDSPREYEIIYVETLDAPVDDSKEEFDLLGFDVACGAPFWSIVADWPKKKHDLHNSKLNQNGLFPNWHDAHNYLVDYLAEDDSGLRDVTLHVWRISSPIDQ